MGLKCADVGQLAGFAVLHMTSWGGVQTGLQCDGVGQLAGSAMLHMVACQGLAAPANSLGAEPSTPVGQKTAGGRLLHFMMFPVHYVLYGRPPGFLTLKGGCAPILEGPVEPCVFGSGADGPQVC